MKILDRYLLKELIGPFFLGVGGFILFMVAHILFLLTDIIVNKRVPFGVVAQMMILRMPAILILTFPVGMLFGTVLAINRLVADNEITSLCTSGISFSRIVLPYAIVGLILSIVTFVSNEKIVPWTTHKSENIVRRMILKQQAPVIDANVFQRGPNNQMFYVGVVDHKAHILRNVIIFELGDGYFPKVTIAKEATWDSKYWYLRDGVVNQYDDNGMLSWEAKFQQLKVLVNVDVENFFAGQKTPQEMTTKELSEQIKRFSRSGQNVKDFVVDFHMKFSLPLANLIVVLIGAPLCLKGPKSGKMIGIAYGFGVIFLYYNLMSIGRAFAINGLIPPVLGAWLPDIVVGSAGLVLIYKVEH